MGVAEFAAGVHIEVYEMIDRRGFCLLPLALQAAEVEEWKFDRLDRLGGHGTRVEGNPKLVDGAIEFNGVDDALFLDVHPLAGAKQFSWELVFRPSRGGKPEQRCFHLTENGSTHRMLFETRLIGEQWCLDSFVASSTGQKALIDRGKLHSLDAWHHVAMVYDGRELRHYVDHKLELSAEVALAPHTEGKCSVGVRYNKIDYFKGAMRLARFHKRAVAASEFHSW